MKFAAITLAVGFAGVLLASNLQGAAMISSAGLPTAVIADADVTGSTAPVAGRNSEAAAVRLIDLKTGASCKTATPPVGDALALAPLGPDCDASPSLARIAYWRSTPGGTLIMADSGGRRVLEFAPGDGVLFESVYPANELITIVPARG